MEVKRLVSIKVEEGNHRQQLYGWFVDAVDEEGNTYTLKAREGKALLLEYFIRKGIPADTRDYWEQYEQMAGALVSKMRG